MSHPPDEPTYNETMGLAWSALSALVSLGIFGMLVFGPALLRLGGWIWDLLRWLASPII
jgi:hypothetical protein